MNQILVTKKLYVTPELKRKKKMYKFSFMLSIFLIIILSSIYIYAEYDKAKNENISQEILKNMKASNDDTTIDANDNVWKITLNSDETIDQETESTDEGSTTESEEYGVYIASNGEKYKTVGSIKIPKIDVEYPILSETTVSLLKIAPCKFWGPNPNEVGNFCIAGHNYRNDKFFSKVPTLVVGDIIEITDLSDQTIKYSVYNKFIVEDTTDVSCTSQYTDGKRIVTLITCTDDSEARVIVQAKEI